MPPSQVSPAENLRTRVHLALARFADEVVGTLARLTLYVGTLALLAILGLAALGRISELPIETELQSVRRAIEAASTPSIDFPNRAGTYKAARRLQQDRRDAGADGTAGAGVTLRGSF